MHNIISVDHTTPEPPGGYAADAPVLVTLASGATRPGRLNDDIEGGGVKAYLASGGQVSAYVEPPGLLAERKAARVAAAWAEQERRFASYLVTVTVDGAPRQYRCDPVTRENITAINGAISRAPGLVPDPRPFTPTGVSEPVDTSHAEFLAIYLAGLAAGDAHYTAYATHKAAISALTTVAAVDAYDITSNWP